MRESGMPLFFTIFYQNVEIGLWLWYDKNIKVAFVLQNNRYKET